MAKTKDTKETVKFIEEMSKDLIFSKERFMLWHAYIDALVGTGKIVDAFEIFIKKINDIEQPGFGFFPIILTNPIIPKTRQFFYDLVNRDHQYIQAGFGFYYVVLNHLLQEFHKDECFNVRTNRMGRFVLTMLKNKQPQAFDISFQKSLDPDTTEASITIKSKYDSRGFCCTPA